MNARLEAKLLRHAVQRTLPGVTPPASITAPVPVEDDPLQAVKLLSDNRARYLAQSAATVGGKVAPLPEARR